MNATHRVLKHARLLAAAGAICVPTLSAGQAAGDLEIPLSEYARDAARFERTFKPGGAMWHPKKRTGLPRNCDKFTRYCYAEAHAVNGVHDLELDKISDNGTVVAFFKTNGASYEDDVYPIINGAGAFLVAFKDPDGTGPRSAGWRMVRVYNDRGTRKLLIVPPPNDPPGSFVPCEPRHTDTVATAGFESCKEKHDALSMKLSNFDEIDRALKRNSPRTKVKQGRFEVFGGPSDVAWVTCHAGCCRAMK